MIIGCCFICVFAVLINKVSLQETVKADIGGSVVLPCSSTEHDHKPQDIDVLWRHNGSEIVCDIVKGERSVGLQDQRYKNRAETFPDEYLRGNFSIRLNNLQYTDAGDFSCFITSPSYSKQETVQLIIKESTTKKESNSTEQENQEEDTEADTVETSPHWISIVVVLLLFILSIAVLIILYLRKKKQASSFSSARRKNTDTNDMSGIKD